MYPSKPMYPGEAWRMNSYAGDQAKRYASKLPNPGVNRFAGAFSTGGVSAAAAQAPGFTSALNASGFGRPSASSSTGRVMVFSGKGSDFTQGKSFTSTLVRKPFKPPTQSGQPNKGRLPTVSTVETRLTQQNNAVILNPITPNEPQTPAYTLPVGKDEDFAFLRGLAKEESEEYAVRKPGSNAKRSPSAGLPSKKRSRT